MCLQLCFAYAFCCLLLCNALLHGLTIQAAVGKVCSQVNLAVGGQLPGVNPGPTTHFPQTLSLDYVRVYKCAWHCWRA